MSEDLKASPPAPGLVEGPLWTGATAIVPAELPAPADTPRTRARPRRGRWFWGSALAFLAAVVLYDTASFLAAAWATNPILGGAFIVLFAMVLISAVVWIRGELREIRKLRRAEFDHDLALRIMEANQYGHALPFIEKLLPSLPVATSVRDRFMASVFDTHSDRDVFRLFGRIVLEPLDRQAYAFVNRAARDSAVGVAASPVAALDAAIALWRSLRMIRQVAGVYGFRPGMPGTFILGRRLLLGTALVATTDIVGNIWAEHLGSRLAGVLSTKLAEGVFAAVRVARLGLLAMELCRPLSFGKEDEPSLNRLRKEIVSAIMRL